MDAATGLETVSLQDMILTLGSPPFLFSLGIAVLLLIYLRRNPSIIREAEKFLKSTPWRLEDAIALTMLLIFLLFLTRSAVSILMMKGLVSADQIIPLSVVLQTILFHLPIVGLVLLRARKLSGSIPAALGLSSQRLLEDAGKGVIAYLASMPAIAAANIISWMTLQALKVPPEPQFAVQILIEPHPSWLKLYLIFMAVISAPIAEELLFRFVCFPSLAKRTSGIRAAFLISLLFALIHMNAYAFLPLFIMALALCAAYAWTRSIIVPITMHAIFNAVNLSLYMLYRAFQSSG